MGCRSSKESGYDGADPCARSSSLPSRRRILDHCKGCGGGYHIVSLRSSTLGSIKLDRGTGSRIHGEKADDDVRDANSWSDMIEARIPKTPTMTPINEPEVINVWELMEGLDDDNCSQIEVGFVDRSLSFHATPPDSDDLVSTSETKLGTCKELTQRRTTSCDGVQPRYSLVKQRIYEFEKKIDNRRADSANNGNAKRKKKKKKKKKKQQLPQSDYACPPGGEAKVVVYLTTLRGIRKTYEDCCDVHAILRGYGVRVDERDTSMHAAFRRELSDILGGRELLPRIFAAGKYLGGADEVREMHELGRLGKALEGCEATTDGEGAVPCELCDDVRFVPCDTCSGSCKLYVGEEDGGGIEYGGFRRCPDCNENGLVRCPICCDD